MTTKEQAMYLVNERIEDSKGLIRGVYEDCAELIGGVKDTELEMARTITDQQEKIRELEEFLEPSVPHFTREKKSDECDDQATSAAGLEFISPVKYPDMAAVHRALGVIEGVSSMLKDPAASLLLAALQTVDEELCKSDYLELCANGQ